MLFFIRHAESIANRFDKELEVRLGTLDIKGSPEYKAEKFKPIYLDAEVTEEGLQQMQEGRARMEDREVDAVIVSPMHRALLTCHTIFQDHKSKPAIFVEPCFREIFESADDIGSKLPQSMLRFPQFEYSPVKDPHAWFVHTLKE
jgi:broad specificity phosphatase PhoE